MDSFRIATWNLNNPPLTGERADACRAKIAKINAQVWVLTETRQAFSPGEDFKCVAQSQIASDLSNDRRWTSIWAASSLKSECEITRDPERTACVRLVIQDGIVLYIYGTVLPWLGSTWTDVSSVEKKVFPAAKGQAFTAALAAQKADWLELQSKNPDAWFCVAGDLNQDLRDSGYYYGSKDNRKTLREALQEAKLTCFTGGRLDPVTRDNSAKANIDHICLNLQIPPITDLDKVTAWSAQHQGKVLSDHMAVCIEIIIDDAL